MVHVYTVMSKYIYIKGPPIFLPSVYAYHPVNIVYKKHWNFSSGIEKFVVMSVELIVASFWSFIDWCHFI